MLRARLRGLLQPLSLAALSFALGGASAAFAQTGPEFTIPTQSAGARDITVGPDGNVWFTETTANKIGRLTPAGTFTEFTLPTTGTQPWSIVSGPGPALWFTQRAAGSVGRITTAGTISEFPLPSPNAQPEGISVGPDGNLWVACYRSDRIVRMTPAGVATEFPVLAAGPTGIAAGPDGNLWATAYDSGEILKITTAGTVTRYALPNLKAFPTEITAGSDGALWFIQSASDRLGRIATDGTITETVLPETGLDLSDISAGPDGSLWLGSRLKGRFIRIAAGGNVIFHPLLSDSYYGGTAAIEGIVVNGAAVFMVLPSRGKIFEFNPQAQAVDFSPRGSLTIRAMTTSPAGEIWYVLGSDSYSSFQGRLGRLGLDGSATEVALPVDATFPYGMHFGPDGKIWVTESSRVARYEPSTAALINRIPLYGSEGTGGLVTGPDGAVWVGRFSRIARIDPSTFGVVEYPFPPPSSYSSGYAVSSLVVGPDGAIWFSFLGNVYRLRLSGNVTVFGTPTSELTTIVRGLDDNFWVLGGQSFQQVTPSGGTTYFGSGGYGLVAGPDGAQWFSDSGVGAGARVVRVTTGGSRSFIQLSYSPFYFGSSNGLYAGAFTSDGNLWLARGDRFTRIKVGSAVTGSGFHIIEPCRLVDTRIADGPSGGPALGANGARTLLLTGRCGIPGDARALALNVTAVGASASGTLSAHPGDVPATGTTAVAFAAGVTRAGFAALALGADGTLTLHNLSTGPTGFILDVTGYFK